MAIALQSAGTLLEATASTTKSVPFPATLDSNTIMVLWLSVNSTTLSTNPLGWTNVFRAAGTAGTTQPALLVSVKRAAGTESGNLSVTSANAAGIGQILAFSGVDTTTPQDVTATSLDQSTASGTLVLPTLTTTKAGVCLVYANGTNSSTTTTTPPTSPGTFTETGDRSTGTAGGSGGYLVWTGSGATGSVTLTFTGTPKSIGALVALRPAATAANTGQFFEMF